MRKLKIQEFKAAFLRLAKLVAQVGEIVVMRHGKPLLRILPGTRRRHARGKIRASMRLKTADGAADHER